MRLAEAGNDLLTIYQAALDAVNGRQRVRQCLGEHPVDGRVHIIAIGKAAISMTEGALDVLAENISDALVITKTGYATPLPWTVYEGGHPLPDVSSMAAGEALLEFVEGLPVDARVLVLLSGGASAIVEVPATGIALDQIIELNQCLLQSGMDIAQCNQLRQRVSRIKAGGLAAMLAPRYTRVLAISDVADDDSAVIASGPLTFSPAQPDPVLPTGLSPELATRLVSANGNNNVPQADHVQYEVIANLELACKAAMEKGRELGYRVSHDQRERLADVTAEAKQFAQQVLALEPGAVVVCGGEPVIHLPTDHGRGGRCQHFALAAAMHIHRHEGVSILAAATDGSDGPGEDAGAVVDAQTCTLIEQHGLDCKAMLDKADSGTALDAAAALISTGPTGTNVRDVFIGMRYM